MGCTLWTSSPYSVLKGAKCDRDGKIFFFAKSYLIPYTKVVKMLSFKYLNLSSLFMVLKSVFVDLLSFCFHFTI